MYLQERDFCLRPKSLTESRDLSPFRTKKGGSTLVVTSLGFTKVKKEKWTMSHTGLVSTTVRGVGRTHLRRTILKYTTLKVL